MPHAPTDALSRRHEAVRSAMAAQQLDALVVTSLPNITYLTNFSGTSAIVVATADAIHFLTDFRYRTAVEEARGTPEECPNLELMLAEGSYDTTLAALLAALRGHVAFESAHLTVSRYNWLTKTLAAGGAACELVPTEGIVERQRVRKDAYEVATLREAARRLSAVARMVSGLIRRGMTERELAMAVDGQIRKAGFERPAFDTIVASGPNAALPHARPTDRKIGEGDLVVLDFGGVYHSYCVDLTRTVFIGPPSRRGREVYAAVLEAHDQAIATAGPSVSRFAVDAAARETLARHGLGEAFGHGTGHGLGIEVHEDPRITRRRSDVDTAHEDIEPGMVFTIEPGAYLAGWGGVRIEDDVLVTETGVEVLTDATTELIEL